ncbi:oligosaccharide flippase family protein [Methyloversatilis sp. XJ19-13]|uniref:lipopolysaccharide biosynthesis protein n=1 Tax=Methyloversatilis sp. XJ19-13 TaxID=2963430 RepID=UPI00211CB3A6|nr:oligosaccharide flippase family protein [Methyloversatilis sp. XJ19-13]
MSVRRNVIANYVGQGWVALMQFAFVPLYIHFLGVEAFGLIGVFTMLQAWMVLLDLGMTPTLTREMARFTAGSHSARSINDLLRTLEWICVAMAAGIVLVIWGVSGWLASDWLQPGALPVSSVADAIALMGIVIALRFVEGIYRGALMGLQRQVFVNAFNGVNATFRAAGALAVLIWLSPTIEAFFIWQACASLFAVAGLALATHRTLPGIDTVARFSKQALLDVRHFAGGMVATTLLALMLTQIDKVLLSRLISLEAFGYYTLAATVASALTLLVGPVTQAVYPRFTEMVTHGESARLAELYHQSAKTVTAICAPVAMVFLIMPDVLLNVWTGDSKISAEAAPILALLSVGTFLNSLMHVPYVLQLAYGWVSFAATMNLIAVLLLVPSIFWLVPHYGAVGAAWAWVALNAGYVSVGLYFMHRRLLPAEKTEWYLKDVFTPLAVAAIVISAFSCLVSDSMPRWLQALLLIGSGISALISCLYSVGRLRFFKAKF